MRYQLPDTLRKFFVMVTVGMCVSVAFGAITVSWFGDSVTAFPFLSGIAPALTSIQLLNPMGDPMTLLMISLALGFIQILYGLFIAFSENWKAGDKFAACADQADGYSSSAASCSSAAPREATYPHRSLCRAR